jgi:hypothetical protein
MVANVPLLSQVGETQGGLQLANNGYGLQLTHTPVYHWGFTGSGNVFTVVNDTNHAYDRKHISGEAATGFYTRLTRTGRFEMYVGLSESSSGNSISRWHMRRYFIQPSIGVSTPRYDLAFTPRFSFVDHYKTSGNTGTIQVEDDNVAFFEPSVTARGGFETFKFSLQFGLAFGLSNKTAPLAADYKGSLLAFGIHLCFGKDFDRYIK